MSRVITFSRTYPSYHPRKGQPTYFVEKIWDSLGLPLHQPTILANGLNEEYLNFQRLGDDLIWPKHTTVRAGHRWKAGDWFSPRVWSGRPYNSKQIIIAPDIQIKKIWNLDIKKQDDSWNVILDGINIYFEGSHSLGGSDKINWIPKNDGLVTSDFFDWFKWTKQEFSGQIICWNENINY